MGDIKKKRKLFSRPKKLFDRVRIEQENVLVEKYGLKNKKEIWKAKSLVSKFRRRAKQLIRASKEEQQIFFNKLNKMGMKVSGISDILALTEENLLDRRLQTFVHKKMFANSPNHARQLIVHKRILVDGAVVNSPSFLITKDLEGKISLKENKEKVKKEVVKEKANGEVAEEENGEG